MANQDYTNFVTQFNKPKTVSAPVQGPIGMTPYQPFAPVQGPTQQTVEPRVPNSAPQTTGAASYKGVPIDYTKDITSQLTAIDNPVSTPSSTPNADSKLSVLGSYDMGTSYKSAADARRAQELTKGEEARYRSGVMSQYQGEIDAAKNAYARLLAEQQQLGVGRLGESTAIQARRGLQGSSFGTGMTEGARKVNLDAEGKVLESQASAIANIMDRANTAAQTEIDYQRAAKKGGLKEYQDAKATQATRKKEIATDVALNLFNAGLDYQALSADDLKSLKGMGISQQDIINAYLTKKKDTGEQFTLGEGQARYDAEGNLIAQGATTPGDGQKIVTINGKSYVQNSDGSFSEPSVPGGTNAPSAYTQERSARTISAVDNLYAQALKNPGIFGRSAAFPLPEAARSDAYRNFTNDLKELTSNIGFNELTQMREASKTGGALGQVSNIELSLLTSALSGLEMSQSPENFQKNLLKIKESVQRFNDAVAAQGGQQNGGDASFAEAW